MSDKRGQESQGNILVVDDTLANLKVLTAFLTAAGYSVAGAPNGKTALMICANRPLDLVLLDIRMPDMDGYEICAQLKKNQKTKDIPIIFISALDDVGDKVKGFEIGALDYITKPFEEREVLVRVQTHISLYRMQQQQQQINAKLRELDKLKSMFIACMSHELRTPLNSIIGFSGILIQGLSGELNEEQKDGMQRIYRSSNHLLGLITDIIDISKIEAGQMKIYPQLISLEEVVEEAMTNLQSLADKKQLELVLIPPPIWTEVETDRKRLLQSLLNFLSNAVKYTEKGQVRISVLNEDEQVNIAVQDTGIGIPEEEMPRLFTAFHRISSPLSVKAGGTGLGLYLTKKIVTELLEGSVSVESHVGQGSTFCLHLPKYRKMTPHRNGETT